MKYIIVRLDYNDNISHFVPNHVKVSSYLQSYTTHTTFINYLNDILINY